MTGLDTQADRIIEIATIVTDSSLRVIAEGPVLAIHQEDVVLGAMDEWNRTTHGGTGLLQRVRDSRLSAADAETQTLEFLAEHVTAGASPMCGNSICQDRRFLAREMPSLERFFHYRKSRCQHCQGTGEAVGPRRSAGVQKSVDAPCVGRHPRIHQRAGTLPASFFEGVRDHEFMLRRDSWIGTQVTNDVQTRLIATVYACMRPLARVLLTIWHYV